jgi:hypothetical protein
MRKLQQFPEHTDFGEDFEDWTISYRLGRTSAGLLVIKTLTIKPKMPAIDENNPIGSMVQAMRQPVPGAGVNWNLIRRLPLGRALRGARAIIKFQDLRASRRNANPLGRPRNYKDRFYREVSQAYAELAQESNVLERLAKRFKRRYSTMRGIVERCRKYGHLAPSGRRPRKHW